ncbi:hypothetical protein, partial [Arthrospira sp. TJSD091]|uniref:hypothetical protein n=1 Tax=Limnospira sp. TaxID=3100384 RepID=UPI00061AE98A
FKAYLRELWLTAEPAPTTTRPSSTSLVAVPCKGQSCVRVVLVFGSYGAGVYSWLELIINN